MKVIYKPWGKEEWLELNENYCYKRIYINKGYKTSYQYHNFKKETNYIISGEAEVWIENDSGEIIKKIMKSGDYFSILPPKKHRVIALTDVVLQEVSTPEVDDVVRLEDDTKRHNGKINSEHETPSVLILAAGEGTRLKQLTTHINKALLPINNKAIISHIIEKFPKEYEIIITLGYKGESLQEYVQIAHPKRKFKFVDANNTKGPGDSTLLCEEYLQHPFYLITADCLIDSELPHLDGNWLGAAPTSYPEKYSTLMVDGYQNILKFTNKDENGFDNAFIGLAGIVEYDIFWRELKKNIKGGGEVVSAFKSPGVYSNLKIKTPKWLDTGNLDDLNKTKDYFKDKPLSLHKDTGEITYKVGDRFIKFNHNKTINKNKALRAKVLKDFIPGGFGSTENFTYYQWEEGKTLYEYDSDFLFDKFLFNTFTKVASAYKTRPELAKAFYVNKTQDRKNLFITKWGEDYYKLVHVINGKKYPSLENIERGIDVEQLTNTNTFYPLFHGDLQFDNIVYNESKDKFIYLDWRDSFAGDVEEGDLYYDLAKMYGGCIISYNLMKDSSNITFSEGSSIINYIIPEIKSLKKFKFNYEKWMVEKGFDLDKVKFMTALIFLNMSPLHDEKFGKLLWFKAIEMLYENR